MPIYSVYRDDSLYFRHLTDDVPKDSSFQMHIHEQCEILYFVRGSAGSLIETSSHRLLPDTLLLMRPMESHSVSQLNRVFKSATGFSVWEYITGKRLASARNLIRAGVPATHAFTSCGFNDYSSFYRLYVKKFGVPPKADIAAKKE